MLQDNSYRPKLLIRNEIWLSIFPKGLACYVPFLNDPPIALVQIPNDLPLTPTMMPTALVLMPNDSPSTPTMMPHINIEPSPTPANEQPRPGHRPKGFNPTRINHPLQTADYGGPRLKPGIYVGAKPGARGGPNGKDAPPDTDSNDPDEPGQRGRIGGAGSTGNRPARFEGTASRHELDGFVKLFFNVFVILIGWEFG